MRSKFSFIILVVTFMLLSSLQIGASSNTGHSDSGLVIEKRPLPTPLPPSTQPNTNQDETQLQEAFTTALSNDPTATLVEIKVEGQWAYGIFERTTSDRFVALARVLPNGIWQVTLPNNALYLQWLTVLPDTLIPPTEKEILRAKSELTSQNLDNLLLQSTLDWETYTDPYWAFTISYPSNWNLQNIPYKDFGFRISSPDLIVDKLGHPVQGSFLSAFVVPMTPDEWDYYEDNRAANNEILDKQILQLSEGEGRQIALLDHDGNYITEKIFYIEGYFYRFRFVQTLNDASDLYIGYQMLSSVELTSKPKEYLQEKSANWIAESRFVYTPSIDAFDIQQWLDNVNSSVGNCYFETDDGIVNYSSLINKISGETGINQRVLLVMSEITHGIVSNPDLDCGVLQGYEKELLDVAIEMMKATATFRSKHIDDQAIETLYTYSRLNRAVNNSSFGIATGVAINAAAYHKSPYDVEKQFYDIYSAYFGDPKTTAPYMELVFKNLNTVTFLMPFVDRRTYSGGPHGVGHPPGCNNTPVNETSGIDFGGGVDQNDPFNTAVISIADGTIVGIKQDTTIGQGGRWVAVEHSNNIVSMYWHLSSINPNLHVGQPIQSGAYLGEIGNSGLPSGYPAHIHLELRTGGLDYSTWSGKGVAVPWTGKDINGWRIYPEINANGFAEGYNGSAVRSGIFVTTKQLNTNCGLVSAEVENLFPHSNETNTARTVFAFESHITWFQSSNSPNCPGQNISREQANTSGLCGGGALAPPLLISPNNGETLENRSVHFAWQNPNSPNQTGYTFRLNTSSNPDTQPWIVDTGLGNEFTSYDHTFAADGTFYWHMRTWNESGEASAWVTRQFHIDTANQSDEVMLCGTDNTSSDCWFFPTGVYNDLSAWGLNDRMRSAVVPAGKSVFLFREGGLRGTAECYSGDRIPLPSGDPWDLRGQVTGVQTFNQSNCPTSQLYSVVMYDNQNYGSHHWGIGYNEGIHNLNQIGGPDDLYFNDRGESVRIPNGWSVRLYEHNDRGGPTSGCLTGDVSSLGSLNNTVSSVEIFHNTSCTPPAPASPSNLSVSGTTDDSISLAWQDNSSNETSFKIYRWGWNGTAWDFLYLDSVAANVTSYTDTGLNCGETHYYTVSAVNNGSESIQANWVQGETAVCPTVEITDAWTGDGNWGAKSTFNPGDSIQWVLTIVNTTGADADIEVSYDVYGPTGEHVLNWNGILTVSNGGWNFGLPGTVADGLGGTNSFDGVGNYQGHITIATTTYVSTGPTQINVGTEQNGSQVTLTWTHRSQNTTYEIWHSPTPYFTPGDGGSIKLATLNAPTSEFIVSTGGFYKIKSLNATGEVVSNEVGIFNFPILPGESPNPTYNWSLVNQSTKPSARAGVTLAVNTDTNKLVLFGGTCAGFACDDTWVYDGNSWQELNISGPSPRENARMVYDSSRQRIVLFGGHVWAGTHLNDTWEFDGSSWSQINTGNTPLGRSNHAMTYDPIRGKVIMFGGWRGTQTGNDILSDTWEYDGTDWTQISTAHSPPANAGSWLSHVSDWNQAIMSVRNSTQQYNATWAYDGTDWTQIGTPTLPRRYNYQMAYNPVQQRLVLFGGYDVLYHTGAYADTWEFDGQQWVEVTSTTSPPATWASEAVYYAPLNGVVMFGGNSPNQNDLVDTMWLYAPDN